ncbi:MAG: glycosyltransferase family 4 protein [Pseudomonadota bacterium]|nr:glycosyltransferase family 4 protein [Pseudomonadota bacterium]
MMAATRAFAQTRPSLAGRTVLQILPRLDAGGAERTTLDVAAAIVRAGGRALVACDGGRLVSDLQVLGGVWLPFPAAAKNPLRMLYNVRKLARLIVDERVDVVHARSRAPAWVALGAARIVERPLVTTYHGAYAGNSALKLRYNSVMARGDAVIANSHYTAGAIEKLYPFARDKLRVIHRGSDLSAFSAGAVDPARVTQLREAWGVAPHERVVLLAARLTGWKGQRVLIEAAAKLHLEGVRYVLAGDPQGRDGYVREIDRLIEAKGLKGVVSRVGHCRDMPAAFLAASVVAVPSTEPEAFGRSAVEAQAMGTPVVVSDLGAVPETVLAPPDVGPEARTGWRIPAGDADALAEALKAALSLGATARDAMARRARAHVERHFSLEQMTTDTLEVYGALLGV